MAEVFTLSEGELRWVQASGSGTGWQTASAPQSGLMGFVTTTTFTSGAPHVAMYDRGIPNHFKRTQRDPINIGVAFNFTGDWPRPSAGQGASVERLHLELKLFNSGLQSGYYQFHGVVLPTVDYAAALEGDTFTLNGLMALSMIRTASGYLG